MLNNNCKPMCGFSTLFLPKNFSENSDYLDSQINSDKIGGKYFAYFFPVRH